MKLCYPPTFLFGPSPTMETGKTIKRAEFEKGVLASLRSAGPRRAFANLMKTYPNRMRRIIKQKGAIV